MKERLINTRFWSDAWVRENLNPLDRYFMLYLLTNEHTNISGIYELSLSQIAFETGLDREEISRTMFPKLEPKAYYKDNWVVLTNFLKYQRTKSDTVLQGIKKSLNDVPKPIIEYAKSVGYGYDMDMIWVSYHISESESELEYEEKHSSFKGTGEKLGKKPYYFGEAMRFTKKDQKWWVLPKEGGAWLEFAGREDEIEWR